MSEPTEAMIEAGTLVFFGLIERKEIDPVSIYLAMKALDPDTHRASSDEVERLRTALKIIQRNAMNKGVGAVDFRFVTERLVSRTLAAMSVQSDKGEG